MSNHSEAPTKAGKAWWRHALEILIILGIFYAILLWQEKHLLNKADDKTAPTQLLVGLDSKTHALPLAQQKQLIYFFAPWCTICHYSIGNIESQKAALLDKGYQVRYVALDWQSHDEVEQFSKEHKLTFPVLLRSLETMQQYRVKGFPTYYLIDEQGQITAGSQGYSTSLGIWLRSLANSNEAL